MDIESKILFTPKDMKPSKSFLRMRGVFNPGGIRLPNKKILLFARVAETPKHDEKIFIAPRFSGEKELKWSVERLNRKKMNIHADYAFTDFKIYRLPTISHLRKVWIDKDGFEIDKISQSPDFFGLKEDGDFGVEDPRIMHLKKENKYVMTYVSVSMHSGVSTSLATSKNFNTWKREGIIFPQQNKDVVIFPEKINGEYVALNRPEGTMIFDKPHIWISYSKDLIYWGKHKPLIHPRSTGWDTVRIGPGTIPIKTAEGWLEFYHGVRLKNPADSDSAKIYSAGAILFDLKNPEKIIARTSPKKPLFGSDLDSEKKGFLNQVVFPTAAIPSLDKKSLLIYSGGADSSITVRKVLVKDVLNSFG
ncbi:MAG: hypothetical protein COV47_00625 [Candidatus Diapherotrites archaeon CG11_big_fil_rev_8_21_14_0_20_37_9]|nr:MAG: hypothetical protein COV47_00625 [Candidatus Diapherotrites archaeon CG11_big_fil_rev_8_21_14_0_20_37_9]